jgi:hypothetical protein
MPAGTLINDFGQFGDQITILNLFKNWIIIRGAKLVTKIMANWKRSRCCSDSICLSGVKKICTSYNKKANHDRNPNIFVQENLIFKDGYPLK